MSGENTIALEVLIQIRDEIAGLNRTRAGLQGAKKDADGLGNAIRQGLGIGGGLALATAGISLLTNSLRASVGEAFRMAEAIKDQSEALGVSSEAYQVLRFELAQAGVESSRLSMAVTQQNSSLAEARAGAGGAAEAYRTLGLSFTAVEQMSPEARLEAVARATFNATDQTRAFAAAGTILGTRGLPQLLNGLKDLATDGYDKVRDAARAAGQVMGEETISMLDGAKKKIDNFRQTTLPIATGTAIGWLQRGMNYVGETAANTLNLMQGLDASALELPAAPGKKPPAVTPPALARAVIPALIGIEEQRASRIENDPLATETERRRELLPILERQLGLHEKLAEANFGLGWQQNMTELGRAADAGTINDEQLAVLQEMQESYAKIREIKADTQANVDTPMLALLRQMNDTTSLINTSLAQGTSQIIGQLGNDVWEAFKGTQAWSQAWSNMGDISGRVLSQIVTQMLVIQAINSVLGIFGFSLSGAGPSIGKIGAMTAVKAAGGANFLTSGPTQLTVGDNPGGIEHVSVTPISGIGQTVVNGQRVAMAGGGSLLAGGRGLDRDSAISIVQNFNVSAGVAGTVRAEVFSMLPLFRQLSVDAVREATARGET